MSSRIYFLFAGLFFVAMNVLLWRSEFGGQDFSVRVPVKTVMDRIFEASDDSNLEIRHRGKKIGYCRWSLDPITPAPGLEESDDSLEGMVREFTGYDIDFDGTIAAGGAKRVRFGLAMILGTNQVWQEFNLTLQLRPMKWEIQSRAADDFVQINIFNGDSVRQHTLHSSDLNDPVGVIRKLSGIPLPIVLDVNSLLPKIRTADDRDPVSLGLEWEAYTDYHQVGNTKIAVYRLEARLFDQHRIQIDVLESGEILKVSLPDNMELRNDDLLGM